MDNQRGLAEVNRTRLYYEVEGTGDSVVFIHGFGSDARVWNAQFAVFAQQYRVLRYDIRGHGKSAVPTSEPYTHTDDLKALLDFCGMAHAHVIGQSVGGEIALDFALAYPDSVRSLVLVDATLGGFEWSDEWAASWLPIVSTASTKGMAAALELVMEHPLLASAVENAEVRTQLAQIFADYTGWHWLNADPIQRPEPPAAKRLSELKVPTLILIAEHDLPDFHAIAATLHQEIPNSTRLDVLGVGHVVPMEAPERLNEIVLGFLAST